MTDICVRIDATPIVLEPLIEAHAAPLFALFRDPVLWQYTEESAPQTLADLQERYRRLAGRRSPDGKELWLNWAIVLPDVGAVGFVQATVSADGTTAQIAYVLGRLYQRRRLASRSVGAMLAFLADTLQVQRFSATVDEHNVASNALLSTLGFTLCDRSDPRNIRWER